MKKRRLFLTVSVRRWMYIIQFVSPFDRKYDSFYSWRCSTHVAHIEPFHKDTHTRAYSIYNAKQRDTDTAQTLCCWIKEMGNK